jgi:hypothetical protein
MAIVTFILMSDHLHWSSFEVNILVFLVWNYLGWVFILLLLISPKAL